MAERMKKTERKGVERCLYGMKKTVWIVFFMAQDQFVEGIAAGGVKG